MNQPTINFHFLTSPFFFPDRTHLKAFLVQLFKKEGYEIDHLNYIFCSDSYLLQINKNFLKHSSYTDIITFPFSGKGLPVLSDLYLSVDRIRANARSFSASFQQELHRVIFHGALHLCGYKDKSFREKEQMRAKENAYLKLYFT